MNDDLISRSALKKAITDATYNFEQIPIRVDKVQEIIDNAPTIEYTFEEAFQKTVCDQRLYCPKIPQGKWIEHWDKGYVECPFCHKQITGGDLNFCVKCGAHMMKETEE